MDDKWIDELDKSRKHDYYGKLFVRRKELETANNNCLRYRQHTERQLADINYEQDTIAREYYEKGMLPPAHILEVDDGQLTFVFLIFIMSCTKSLWTTSSCSLCAWP